MNGQAAEPEDAQAERGPEARVAVVGQQRKAAEPGQVHLACARALDKEIEDDRRRQGGQFDAVMQFAKDACHGGVYVRYVLRHEAGD